MAAHMLRGTKPGVVTPQALCLSLLHAARRPALTADVVDVLPEDVRTDKRPSRHLLQSPNQKIPDRKTKCVIKTHINIKQNVIFGAKLKPV